MTVAKKTEGMGQPLRCLRPPKMLWMMPYDWSLIESSQVTVINWGTWEDFRPPGGFGQSERLSGLQGTAAQHGGEGAAGARQSQR